MIERATPSNREYSYSEIADILGVTSKQVQKIEREALAKIERALEGLDL